MANIKKAGVPFIVTLDLTPDLSDNADKFKVILRKNIDGSETTIVDGSDGAEVTELDSLAGTYQFEMMIDEVGDYTLLVDADITAFNKVAAAFVVTSASIDDVKAVVDDSLVKIEAIKSQVDLLDEDGLNAIVDKTNSLQVTIENIRDLITDVTATIKVSGDKTADVNNGDVLSGETTNALGNVVSSSYDSDNDVTAIVLDNVKGIFDVETPENLYNGDVDLGGISEVAYGGGAVDSVMEFVKSLNAELTDGASGLEALATYSKDIEHILNGDDTLEDGSDNPTAGKGLVAIFNNVDGISDDIADLSSQLDSVKSDLSDAINSAKSDIQDSVQAVKDVVDANKSLLEDDTYGLSALKDLVDQLSTDLSDDTKSITDILNDDTYGLSALNDTITNRFDSVDSALVDVNAKLDNLGAIVRTNVQI